MKIAVICDVFGEPNNGTVLAALNLIGYLKRAGHEVRVVSSNINTAGKEGFYVVPHLNLGPIINYAVEKNEVELSKADRQILLRAIGGADVVHLLVPFSLSWGAVKVAEELGVPMTASFHCQAENFTSHIGLMNSRLAAKAVYRVFDKKVYSHCVQIHYPTEFIRADYEGAVHKETPGLVISNGVDDMFFDYSRPRVPQEKFTIVCVGRYSKEKAQEVLLKALSMSRFKEMIRLVLAGEGPRRKEYERLVKKYGLDCEMRFYPREELCELLHNADLYVHTAVAELESIACLEAIVSGLVPVICDSERSATRFFAVGKRNLYQKGNERDLCRKIDHFYEYPQSLKRYREQYQKKARAFRQEECMREMEKMLEAAARKGASGASDREAGK